VTYDGEIYDKAYYGGRGHQDCARNHALLRYQDEAAALAYAFGLSSYDVVEDALGVLGLSLQFEGQDASHKGKYHPGGCRSLWDTVAVVGETWRDQVRRIVNYTPGQQPPSRVPKGVVDIGGGAGVLALVLGALGIPVELLEPAACAPELLEETRQKYGLGWVQNVHLCRKLEEVRWGENTDTVILCSTLEHIEKGDFTPILAEIRKWLGPNKGRLIVVNTICNHPLQATGWDHCTLVDDAYYDELSEGTTTVFRRGSHLVVDF
jgi:hypothetical protein